MSATFVTLPSTSLTIKSVKACLAFGPLSTLLPSSMDNEEAIVEKGRFVRPLPSYVGLLRS